MNATNKITKELQQFYDLDAPRYRLSQWSNSVTADSFYQATRNIIMEQLDLTTRETMLEIGCGPGTWTKEVAPFVKNLTAIDLSGKMLEQARNYIQLKNVEFKQGEFLEVDFENKKYDCILSVRVFEYFQNKKGFLDKCYSLLNPGGKLVIATKSNSVVWQKRNKLYKLVRRLWPSKVNAELDIPNQKGYDKLFWQKLISASQFVKLAKNTGFSSICAFPIQVRLPVIAGGLQEIPLLSGNHAARYISLSNDITKTIFYKHFNIFGCRFSESYIIKAIKL